MRVFCATSVTFCHEKKTLTPALSRRERGKMRVLYSTIHVLLFLTSVSL